MSGHFDAFKNREKISEFKKKSLREALLNKKENLQGKDTLLNGSFPNLSASELEKIKLEINQSIKIKKQQQSKVMLVFFSLIIAIILFMGIKFNIF